MAHLIARGNVPLPLLSSFPCSDVRQVGWTRANHEIIMVCKVQFSMGQIRTVVYGLLATICKRLVAELMMLIPGVGD
jgi:hypothetical protein